MSTENDQEVVIATSLSAGSFVAGRYKIIRLLAVGGMASIYLAADTQSKGVVRALKVLHKSFVGDKTHVSRFLQEVQIMNSIKHPNVVRTYDIGTDGDLVYFTMEYVNGESLEQFLERSTLTSPQIARLVVGICDGLAVIHERGIIHRDLKPGNILISKDRIAKITDFGIARRGKSSLTAHGQKIGSLHYISPEIWRGNDPSPPADFYSLGIVLYELVAGATPFEGDSPAAMMDQHLNEKVVPPKDYNPNLPDWLNDLILWLLEKSPEDRPQHACEISNFVTAYASEELLSGNYLKVRSVSLASVLYDIPDSSADIAEKKYILRLTATRLFDSSQFPTIQEPRKATVVIPLPKHAAFVFEVEMPSRDFLYFGLFLASLQIFDGVLTSIGVERFTTQSEGNFLLRELMIRYGPYPTLTVVKLVAIISVAGLTVIAKRITLVKNVIAVLSAIYLIAAILPWIYVLYIR